MTHYFRNKAGNKVIGIDADRVTEYDLLFTMGDEQPLIFTTTTEEVKGFKHKADTKNTGGAVDEKERKKQYMRDWYAKKKKGVKSVSKKGEGNVNVLNDPNLKLIQEYGKSCIDAVIKCKRDGMTVDEIDADQPKGLGHLTYGQIETLYDSVIM